MKRKRKNSLLYNMIIVYPLLNLLVCTAYDGDNMSFFSFAYSMMLCILGIAEKRNKISKRLMIMIPFLVFTVILSFLRETTLTNAVSSLLFSVTVLFFSIFSEEKNEVIKQEIILSKSLLYIAIQSLYFAILLYWTLKNGLRAGWNTWVLQGPYNYPHTLSYILLFMMMGDLFFFQKNKTKLFLIYAVICMIMIFMTAVRSSLISAVIVCVYFFREILSRRKMKYFFAVIVVFIIAYYVVEKYALLNALKSKNRIAVEVNKSLSNGRFRILESSIKTITNYQGNRLLAFFFGAGLSELLTNNGIFLGSYIHAHNDLVDCFVCYGIIGLIVYIFAFLNFGKKSRAWIIFTLGVLAVGNGLYVYIDCVPMLVFIRLFFDSGEKLGTWSIMSRFKGYLNNR